MNIELPDTSRWGEPDWGLKVLPREGKGINLRDCFVGQAGEVSEQVPTNQGLAQRGSIVDPNTPDFGFPINRKIEVWTDNIADLVEQGYEGCVSLETHWRVGPEQIEQTLLELPGGKQFSEAGEAASRVCMRNTLELLAELGVDRSA